MDGKILFDSQKGIMVPREQRPSVGETLHGIYRCCWTQRRLFKPDYLIRLLELGPILDQTMALLAAGDRQKDMLAGSQLKFF